MRRLARRPAKVRKQFEQAFCHQPKAIKTIVEHWKPIPESTGNSCGPRMWWSCPSHRSTPEGGCPPIQVRRHATWLIWKNLMVAEKNFWKFNAPHLVEKVAEGGMFTKGVEGAVKKNAQLMLFAQ